MRYISRGINHFFVLMVLPPILNWAETVRAPPAKKAKDNKIFSCFKLVSCL